jgi:phage baseplate assembly protein V
MNRALAKFIAPLSRRVRLIASRAVLNVVDDGAGEQTVQASLLAGETRDNIERMQQYGFSSVPLAGAEGVFLSLGAVRDNGVMIIAGDRRFRAKGLQGGEVAIYTDEGDRITLKRNHEIEIKTKVLTIKAETKVRMETPLCEVTGQIKDLCETSAGSTMSAMRITYNGHTHNENNTSDGPTNIPNQSMPV